MLPHLVLPGELCRDLESTAGLPFAAHCKNTAWDCFISPQLTSAESCISLRALQHPPPPRHAQLPQRHAISLQAATPARLGFHSCPGETTACRQSSMKNAVFWAPPDAEFGRRLPNLPSPPPTFQHHDFHPRMSAVLRKVKLTLEQAEQCKLEISHILHIYLCRRRQSYLQECEVVAHVHLLWHFLASLCDAVSGVCTVGSHLCQNKATTCPALVPFMSWSSSRNIH